ncbi:hypothetical protein JOC27_002416 [Sporolactobacillus spathodeae]|uniref:Uncharacterized protein n=1 Tax=Sporolactobacillus spathodeae TaxID=1465502 RepID=A0ABS2QAW0_9BACL|nr:hypothetical protein [Sporolactobacillus spathodeae]
MNDSHVDRYKKCAPAARLPRRRASPQTTTRNLRGLNWIVFPAGVSRFRSFFCADSYTFVAFKKSAREGRFFHWII